MLATDITAQTLEVKKESTLQHSFKNDTLDIAYSKTLLPRREMMDSTYREITASTTVILPDSMSLIEKSRQKERKKIDMGHAKALLSLDSHSEQIALYNDIVKNGYSVREVEEMVRRIKDGGEPKATAEKKNTEKKQQDAMFHQLKKQLTNFFQTPVQMTCSAKGCGKISIKFKNEKELERIISIFDRLNK